VYCNKLNEISQYISLGAATVDLTVCDACQFYNFFGNVFAWLDVFMELLKFFLSDRIIHDCRKLNDKVSSFIKASSFNI
jgi:hypothetical protein